MEIHEELLKLLRIAFGLGLEDKEALDYVAQESGHELTGSELSELGEYATLLGEGNLAGFCSGLVGGDASILPVAAEAAVPTQIIRQIRQVTHVHEGNQYYNETIIDKRVIVDVEGDVDGDILVDQGDDEVDNINADDSTIVNDSDVDESAVGSGATQVSSGGGAEDAETVDAEPTVDSPLFGEVPEAGLSEAQGTDASFGDGVLGGGSGDSLHVDVESHTDVDPLSKVTDVSSVSMGSSEEIGAEGEFGTHTLFVSETSYSIEAGASALPLTSEEIGFPGSEEEAASQILAVE